MIVNILFAGGALAYSGVKLLKSLKDSKKPENIDSTDIQKKEELEDEYEFNQDLKTEINNEIMISSSSLGFGLIGATLFPPLIIPCVGGLIYLTIPVWKRGYRSLFKHHKINMSVLDSIALPAIFFTGHYLIAATGYWVYVFGQKILIETEDSSMQSLIGVFGEHPKFVWVLREHIEIEIPFEHLEIGDTIIVSAGEAIPVDGKIIEGIASVDQHVLTGESQPVEKESGAQVFASTIVLSGKIQVEVEKAGNDTVTAQIAKMLEATIDFKTSIQSRGQRISDDSIVPTLVVSALAFPVTGYMGSLALLFSCVGDNIRIISPLSVLNYLKISSDLGVLIKDGRALELLSSVDTVVFDKTGTLTEEQPHIAQIHPVGEYDEEQLLYYAAAAEYRQNHPIALAILEAAAERGLELPDIDDAEYEIGYGIKVCLDKQVIRVGSVRFMEMENIPLTDTIKAIVERCYQAGHSVILVSVAGVLAGAVELHATLRPEAHSVLKSLKANGLATYIISGDNEEPTKRLAAELNIDHYFANTLPENKAQLIDELKQQGKTVCFIGDGINDSIALKTAHVSVSLKGASTIATDTAQIVLMDASLKHLPQIFDLAKELDKNLNAGLATTIVPCVLTISGVFLAHLTVVGSLVLFNAGLMAGVANSMRPLIGHKKNSLLAKNTTSHKELD